MRDVAVIGVGMLPFGKHPDKGLDDMARVAIWDAIRDAGVTAKDIQVVHVGNCLAGLIVGQEAVRGQIILKDCGLGGRPVVNTENACGTGAAAFRGAWLEVASGMYDVALAVGVEKMFIPGNTARSIRALATCSELELSRTGFQYVAYYAMRLRAYMEEYGATVTDFANVVVKDTYNGSLNPYAHHKKALTLEEVLNSRMVADPLTLYMCPSMCDGAGAAILCSVDMAKRFTAKPVVKVKSVAFRASKFSPHGEWDDPHTFTLCADEAYEKAGIGPKDLDVAEVADAVIPMELLLYERLRFCGKGEGSKLIRDGTTRLDGRLPVNTSGGFSIRGHPLGATGLGELAEVVWQLRGEAGPRQVPNAKLGMVHDSGGVVGYDTAACYIMILSR